MSGNPSPDFLPFARPDTGAEEARAVAKVLESGWLTGGPQVREFESSFAKIIQLPNTDQALAVSSATAALHLALVDAQIGEGDFVILPSFTFAATAEVILYQKAIPIFADVDDTGCLSAQTIAEALDRACKLYPQQGLPTPSPDRVKAVMPVHYAGLAADLDPIVEMCSHNGWNLVEDAAHAFPTRYGQRYIGVPAEAGIGNYVCFSFYATKTITTGEGGMLTFAGGQSKAETERRRRRLEVMRLHGLSRSTWRRHPQAGQQSTQPLPSWHYDIESVGFKYNLNDVAAAIGVVQLKKAVAFTDKRREIAALYDVQLKNVPGLSTPPIPPSAVGDHCYYLYPIHIGPQCPINRDELSKRLEAAGIGTSVHFIPLHRHSLYREILPWRKEHFPKTEDIYQGILSLPIYSKMTMGDAQRVITAVQETVG